MSSLLEAVQSQLNEVIDPCSVSAGAALSIVEMGLVTVCEVDSEGDVDIHLRLSSPGCLMGGLMFAPDIEHRLANLEGVNDVSITLDDPHTWNEEAIDPAARQRLEKARAEGRARLREALASRANATSSRTLEKAVGHD